MNEVTTFRLYILRATYLLLLVGLGLTVWPGIVHHKLSTPLMNGVVSSILSTVAVLAIIGLRYPLKMLPLLFFELIWKTTWLLAFALPLHNAGLVDADTKQTIVACLMGVIFPIAIPWPYVYRKYIKEPGDRWWRMTAG